ncbi:MAG: peptidoglycan DD-metalloendopeptidase family protein [Myxococcales bacterium]|jgi:septal ring factor EnvC (AmiA/AmiB activator)
MSKRAFTVLSCLLALALPLAAPPVHGQHGGIGHDVEIAGLLDEIEAGTARRQRLSQELESVTSARKQLGQSLRRQVRALYRMTRSGFAPVGGGFEAVLRHVARVKRLRGLVSAQSEKLQALESKHKRLHADNAKVALSVERARTRLDELQRAPRGRSQGISNVFNQDSGYRAAATAPAGGQFYGLRLVDPVPATTFAAQRGKLASPVTGDVRVVSARREESDGPGLEFQAPVGTPVRAVAAGRVAFSDRYGSYGRLVILDHGDGFYTVYGGLGAVEVRVGDDLSRNARIGSIGTDYSPSGLFFEVRQGTRTLEPHGWLGF